MSPLAGFLPASTMFKVRPTFFSLGCNLFRGNNQQKTFRLILSYQKTRTLKAEKSVEEFNVTNEHVEAVTSPQETRPFETLPAVSGNDLRKFTTGSLDRTGS